MADKDIKIGIKTTGAETAASQVRKVETATEGLNRAQRQADFSTEKVRVSEFAYYDLGAEIDKTRQKTETFTSGVTKLQQPTRNSSQALLLFSQGFEDASYGIRGVLNNIPGLIVALGGTAGLAGAISIAAVGFSMLYEQFGKTDEKAKDLKGSVDEVAEAMAKMEAKKFDQLTTGITGVFDRVESLKVKFEETKKAESDFAISTLDNAAKIEIAEKNIAKALGLQVGSKRELIAMAEAEAAKRELIARQAIESEKQRLAASQEVANVEAEKLTAARTQLEIETAKEAKLREQLVAMREQEASLKRVSKEFIPGRDAISQFTDKVPAFQRPTQGAKDAKEALRVFDYSAAIAGMQARLLALDDAVKGLAKEVSKAENSLNAANAAVTDLSTAVETNIQKIEATLAADTLVAKSETLVATGEQFATDIKSALEQVEATTETGKAAKDTLVAAAADGKITANEQAGVAKSLQTLMGQIQSGQATFSGNMRDLISLQQNFLKDQMQSAIQVQKLKAQAQQQAAQINQIYSRIR